MTATPNPAKAVRFEAVLDQSQPAQVLWLEYGMLAFRAIEQHFDAPASELQKTMQEGGTGFGDLLHLFHAGLIKWHPSVSVETAASIMDTLGHKGSQKLMQSAFLLAFDEVDEDDDAPPVPPKAPNRNARRAAASKTKRRAPQSKGS